MNTVSTANKIASAVLAVPRAIGTTVDLAVQSLRPAQAGLGESSLGRSFERNSAYMYALPVIPGVGDFFATLVSGKATTDRDVARHAVTGFLQMVVTGTLLLTGGLLPAVAAGVVIAIPNAIRGHENVRQPQQPWSAWWP